MSDCMINPYSSGVCVLGTKRCVMKHTGIVKRDKRIAELEASIESKSDIISRLYDQIESMEKHRCDHCGANIIDNCPRCGAPQCCPQCCRIAELEAEAKELHATIMKIHNEYRPDVIDAERYRWHRAHCPQSLSLCAYWVKAARAFPLDDPDGATDAAIKGEKC